MYSLPKMLVTDIIHELVRTDKVKHIYVVMNILWRLCYEFNDIFFDFSETYFFIKIIFDHHYMLLTL